MVGRSRAHIWYIVGRKRTKSVPLTFPSCIMLEISDGLYSLMSRSFSRRNKSIVYSFVCCNSVLSWYIGSVWVSSNHSHRVQDSYPKCVKLVKLGLGETYIFLLTVSPTMLSALSKLALWWSIQTAGSTRSSWDGSNRFTFPRNR